MAETGSLYLHYGIALIEALVIAKVVLIGKLFGFTRRFDDRALIVPVVYKSVRFGLLVMGRAAGDRGRRRERADGAR